MQWVLLSLLAAFGQALGWALKKKALNKSGINNITGLVSSSVATLFLVGLYFLFEKKEFVLTPLFWWATLWIVVLNIIAVWTGYRALDRGSLSVLMPFMSLTALLIIFVEYLLRGTLPNSYQFFGISLIVLGAIVSSLQKVPNKESLAVAGYFAVTLLCYSVTSPLMGVAVSESQSGLFAAVVMYFGIALGFIPLVLLSGEKKTMKALHQENKWRPLFFWMILAGAVMGLLESAPINVALESASASEVFALKRTMPFFALILGVMMFQEKIMLRHFFGTILLVLGSVLVIWFQ